ncbi:hypothetical protein LOTGIDRAFT_161100 [Lottia gigantea]|uniref:Uncharacterized protein n=1 Tax=Lottia gigantea TaxID=225164 RepID=V3ZTT4_LOTGI|nr:hypothetical protein LOTGIDRAFT_161100 [Lottia gigantea]ESO94848.1 hypothetical protein LOTGIDRAFT_161100 [Lottia gigantea]
MSFYDVTQNETPDPNVLYCFILGLPLPFSTRLPSLQQPVSNSQITQDKAYLWLNYCLLLELQGDIHECNEMYETALSSTCKASELCKLWVGYAEFICRQIEQNTDNTGPSNQLLHIITRSITSMPTKFHPAWCEDRLQVNYNHVNGLIDYYLCRLPSNDHMTMLEKYHHMMPDNVDLLIRTCEEGLRRGEYYRVSSLTNTAVYDQVANIDFWKMVVSLKLREGRYKEFLLFEVTQKDEEGVQKILSESEEYGLNIKGFVATISS